MKQNAYGFTLVELLIVITILGFAAMVAMPNLSATRPILLELTAQEIADAVEFARDESIRTGTEHGVNISASQQRVQVFRADTSTTPPTLHYDVYHPLSKKLYDLTLKEHSFARLHAITQTVNARGSCNSPEIIIFNRYGTAFCGDPYSSLFIDNSFVLTLDGASYRVSIFGVTGRVTVQ